VKVYKATGFILKKIFSKEKDKTVVIFTKEFGKIFLIGKSVQTITSRRLGCLDTLNYVEFNFSTRGNFHYLKEISLLSSLESLKFDYQKKKNLLLFCEILDKILPVGQVETEVFDLTKNFLVKLAQEREEEELLKTAFNQLLFKLGYLESSQKIKSLKSLNQHLEEITEKKVVSWRL